MLKKTPLVALVLMFGHAAEAAEYNGPAGYLSSTRNQSTWAKYCVGTANSTSKPEVNYANADVKKAAGILTRVSPRSYYFYSGPIKAYGLGTSDSNLNPPPASAPPGTGKLAHAFLALLCGEFRDRAGMVEAKIRWVNNMFTLPTTPQGPVDTTKNVWSQMSAHSYRPYLRLSSALFYAKQQGNPDIKLSDTYAAVDAPVEAQTICETKYMMAEYVAKNKPFDNLQSFNAGLKSFSDAGNCTQTDKDYYYDFRGDSNFKPNSPESNGMIWYSSSISNHCKDTTTAKDTKVTNAECEAYFKAPFRSRWNAARAGLGAWLFRDTKHDAMFREEGQDVVIRPHRDGRKRPFKFAFSLDATTWLEEFMSAWTTLTGAWTKKDMGFNALTKLGTAGVNVNLAYERLRDAVNRHTDWYNSGFNDGIGMKRRQAYSPFVASSYEMSESDNFTSPGTTVSSPSDGKKHWMFVFRVKKTNWYNSKSLKDNKAVNFDENWFDETSLGTNGLAKSEKAWDRLGTALEGELDSILYLHNISSYGEVDP
ncbi:MAG: hypothetical protein HYY84_03690 [Deltaproteobacteria bacterium]|nr:hypothetical protein [Deltaproteobacteria bacterium]